jgi:Zn-dependent metalloprotease
MSRTVVVVLSVAAVSAAAAPAALAADPSPQEARAQLAADAQGPPVVVARGRRATFVAARVPAARVGAAPAASARDVALAALRRYRGLLGLRDVGAELRYVATRANGLDGQTVTFEQARAGVPVFNTRVAVHLEDTSALRAIGAGVAPAAGVRAAAVTPRLDAAGAEQAARRAQPGAQALGAPRLVLYAGPLADAPRAQLAYAVDLMLADGVTHVLQVVDAASGAPLATLDRTYDARNRRTYNAFNRTSLPGTLTLTETAGSTSDPDVRAAHDQAGVTYGYYASTFGRDSYDGAGATIVSTANYGRSYRNAFWNGRQMVYGDGFAVNDVVAHELTHAVTERTAGLEYVAQPGALNESLSDMAAWDVDAGDSTIGEDLPIGAIRDMRTPTAYGQPATASAYVCTSQDNGGVHTNSGIPNRVYANLVDGLGRSAAEQIRYRAQTVYLGPTASFADARAAFVQSARDLGRSTSTTAGAWERQGVTASWQPSC